MPNEPFNTGTDDAKQIAAALGDLRELLREVVHRLNHIERRVAIAYPGLLPKRAKSGSSIRRRNPRDLGPATITAQEALELYEKLRQTHTDKGLDEVRRRLGEMSLADLDLLRRELGVSLGKKKPSQRVLTDAILSRLGESAMISKHTRREPHATVAPSVVPAAPSTGADHAANDQ